jgi:hypothetical protein
LKRYASTSTTTRSLAAAAAVALVATLVPTAAGAQSAPISRSAVCPPPGGGSGTSFSDTDGTFHRDSIQCAAAYELVSGFTDGTYRPSVAITRGQMATFTRNLVETATGDAMPAGSARFDDTRGNTHESAINALAEAGIVQGRAGRFEPNAPVRRDQMATFVANALDWAADGSVDGSTPPATDQRPFGDVDGNTHRAAIERLAAVGIVQGRSQGRYEPSQQVPRGQMATFVMNGAAYLDTIEAWEPTREEVSGVTSPRPVRPAASDTRAPQLASVELIASSAFQRRAQYRFTFSEVLASTIDAQHLALVEPRSDRRLAGDSPGVTVTRTADQRGLIVEVDFDTAGQRYSFADIHRFTTAAVERGAVRNGTRTTVLNAPGSVALDAVSYASGRTDDADLLSVRNVRDHTGANDREELTVDLVFDRAVPTLTDSARFRLVLEDGSSLSSYFGEPVGDGRVVRAFFVLPDGADEAADVADELRRAGVRAGAWAGGATQVIDVADGGGTDAPDLVDVVLHPGTNVAVFRFDQELAGGVEADRFRLVRLDGTQSAAPTRATVDGKDVHVTFPAGQVDQRVVTRATVEWGAVRLPSAAPIPVLGEELVPGAPNAIDAHGFARHFPAGRTLAPGLDSVRAEAGLGANEVLVTYRFDRHPAKLVPARFTVVDANGTATTATRCQSLEAREVTCEYRPTTSTPIRYAGFFDGAYQGTTAMGDQPAHPDGIPLS